ncbi:uncharacterized protein SCHCODRAFT_02639908 [Schizophyllum commune H4-8]|uniref:uncharacterized protein n=1 Tax=Schizophyllum commune (strain H4-8 / FGSC 9210) TaxID=578458 RepID=UPI00215FF28D|nr:uncharacterized protein SCHCODRAFT_02639908 [Schizophyllum commune H4-8]KAI5886821.1 hypothetical protein SCHCODRAFT_02639908 [Schizophyllum commune H4-8]
MFAGLPLHFFLLLFPHVPFPVFISPRPLILLPVVVSPSPSSSPLPRRHLTFFGVHPPPLHVLCRLPLPLSRTTSPSSLHSSFPALPLCPLPQTALSPFLLYSNPIGYGVTANIAASHSPIGCSARQLGVRFPVSEYGHGTCFFRAPEIHVAPCSRNPCCIVLPKSMLYRAPEIHVCLSRSRDPCFLLAHKTYIFFRAPATYIFFRALATYIFFRALATYIFLRAPKTHIFLRAPATYISYRAPETHPYCGAR